MLQLILNIVTIYVLIIVQCFYISVYCNACFVSSTCEMGTQCRLLTDRVEDDEEEEEDESKYVEAPAESHDPDYNVEDEEIDSDDDYMEEDEIEM